MPRRHAFHLRFSEPTYPLTRDEFRRALRTGHGRVLIHAKRHGVRGVEADILAATETVLLFDQQIEPARSWWLAELCRAAGLVQHIIERDPPEEIEALGQHAELLRELAHDEPYRARRALYDLFHEALEAGMDVGGDEIVELDGEKGLLHVVRAMAEERGGNPELELDESPLWTFDDRYGEGRARAVLESASRSDRLVRDFLDALDADALLNPILPRKPRASVEEVLARIEEPTRRGMALSQWGKGATSEEMRHVFDRLLEESDPERLVVCLRVFEDVGLPRLTPKLLSLAEHESGTVRELAGLALSHHSEPEVRVAGLNALDRGEPRLGLTLLCRSATRQDRDRLVAALELCEEPWRQHHLGLAALALAEANPEAADPRLSLYIYEYSPCSHCRHEAVQLLLARAECPAWILDEAAFDGSADIRDLVARHK